MFQLLDPSGHLVDPRENPDAPELHHHLAQIAEDLQPETLRAFLRDMTIMRRFDNEATSLQRQGELGLWAQALGQEGGQVGSAHALRKQDQIFPSYREHPVAWVRGVDVVELLKLFRGVQHGGWDPTSEHNFHIYTLVRSEEHTSELQSRGHLVCRLLLEKKKYRHDNNSSGELHSQ